MIVLGAGGWDMVAKAAVNKDFKFVRYGNHPISITVRTGMS